MTSLYKLNKAGLEWCGKHEPVVPLYTSLEGPPPPPLEQALTPATSLLEHFLFNFIRA
jgi:hypothetical protein